MGSIYVYSLVVLFCLGCSLVSSDPNQVSGYTQISSNLFEAFPEGDKEALKDITVKDLIQQTRERYVEPRRMITACPAIPVPAPTNDVTNLKPGHIRVVMAMGDSITAAMSAKDTLLVNLKEYRGISYAIGGDAGVTTMPNLLKQYTEGAYPIGQATGTGLRSSAGTGYDAAVSGSLNVDMPGQAGWLYEQLIANPKINMKEDWKLLTIWIGSNDLCAVCKNGPAHDVNDYEKRLTEALDYVYDHFPRTFVNLIANLDVSQLNSFKNGTCGSLHLYECGCTSSNAALVVKTTKEYQARSFVIANKYNARRNPEFAVVVQPFLIDSRIFDRTYLSVADCFHPSALCHQSISIALWNSMITPVAQKKHEFVPGETPLCATADSLLYTK